MTAQKTKVSSWAIWARKRKEKKLCVRCGSKAKRFILCDRCHEAELARKRLKARAFLIRCYPEGADFLKTPQPFTEDETEKLSEAAPIVAEICERLNELEQIRLGMAVDVVTRLVRICEISHTAFRYTVRLMHGDATVFSSFQEQAEQRAISKQAAHAEFHGVLSAIERAFPELSHQIRHIRGQVSRAEEASTHRTNSQGVVITTQRDER